MDQKRQPQSVSVKPLVKEGYSATSIDIESHSVVGKSRVRYYSIPKIAGT